jgi:hypothetical protein
MNEAGLLLMLRLLSAVLLLCFLGAMAWLGFAPGRGGDRAGPDFTRAFARFSQ